MSSKQQLDTVTISGNNLPSAKLYLPTDVGTPTVAFRHDYQDETVEVVLQHSSIPYPVHTECSAATAEQAWSLFCRCASHGQAAFVDHYRRATS